jgi:hypothetical protein
MVKHIQETVSSTYISWMYDCDTVYKMLVSLRKRPKPKDIRRRELINKLIKLQDHPGSYRIDEWSQEYEKTVPDFDREYVVQGFLQATSRLNPEFATFYEMTVSATSPNYLFRARDMWPVTHYSDRLPSRCIRLYARGSRVRSFG